METCFSEGKLMKQFGNLPFQLTPLFLSNFFMTPLFVQISKMAIRGKRGKREVQKFKNESENLKNESNLLGEQIAFFITFEMLS